MEDGEATLMSKQNSLNKISGYRLIKQMEDSRNNFSKNPQNGGQTRNQDMSKAGSKEFLAETS
jgi:hypothetical protein